MDEAQEGKASAEPQKRGRVDRFRQRPKTDPIADLAQFGYVGQRRVEAEESEGEKIPDWYQQFQLVDIERIRPGPYQVRLVNDPDKDEQLRKHIREDLNRYGMVQHVFIVVPDQEDGNYFNPQMGGHRRLQISREEGAKQAYIWVKDFDQEELARGTYAENDSNARKDLNIIEEGELFRRVQQRLDWSQTMIAERFHVHGGQPHVARCIEAVSYPEDIRQMIFADEDRGMRAAHILSLLDEAIGPKKAVEARAPLIEAFLAKKLTTDQLQVAVNHLMRKPLPGQMTLPGKHAAQRAEAVVPLSIEETQWLDQATKVRKSVERFVKELGEGKPSAETREELERARQHIETILARQ